MEHVRRSGAHSPGRSRRFGATMVVAAGAVLLGAAPALAIGATGGHADHQWSRQEAAPTAVVNAQQPANAGPDVMLSIIGGAGLVCGGTALIVVLRRAGRRES
jgi:hypothetical protein